MKTVYLVRHAKAEGQEASAPLTEIGKEQAEKLVDFFKNKKVERIYSSPFKRAVETIVPTANQKGVKIIEDTRLSERVLCGYQLEDWQERLKQSFDDFDMIFEGGECNADGMKRAVSILEEVLESEDHHIVLVSHGNMTVLLLRYFNDSFGFDQLMEMTNPDVFEVVVSSEQTVLNRIWDELT